MKKLLFATVAASAIAVACPAYAQDSGGDGESSLELDLRFANNIDTSVTTDVTYFKDVSLEGSVDLSGSVNVDSSAVAVNDVKQLQTGVEVTYREENELNGENGWVDAVYGPGVSESGQDPNDNRTDGVVQDRIRVGFFAPIINTVDTFDVDGSGNIGVNLAAGYFNMQLNSAALATSDNSDDDADGGWAEASTTSLQSLLGVSQYATEGDILNEDDPESGGGSNNFRDRNSVLGGNISGSGNIGVNAAAGSLNQQANLMTLAVANNSTLAEANAGLVQASTLNFVEQQDSQNVVSGLAITGASGNVGVNFAAGVGNQQLNSLTIAASQGGGGVDPDPDPGPGGGDPS